MIFSDNSDKCDMVPILNKEHRNVKSGLVLFFSLIAAVSLAPRALFGVEIAPASARDITEALGPDARGLTISQDILPDLFALTASRIEENPKQFTVVQPYLAGRWKGGRVVIEYARDLSYTLVSVYDKEGHRQRIYSVRTTFSEHVARQEAQEVPTTQSDNEGWGKSGSPPQEAARPAEEARSEWTARPEADQADRKSSAKPAQSANVQPTESAQVTAGFEWDEASGSYVPVAAAGATISSGETTKAAENKETPSTRRRRKRHHEETVVASARTSQSPPLAQRQNTLPAPMQDSGIWLPSDNKAKAARTSGAEVKAANATWEERPTSEPAEQKTTRKKRRKHSDASAPVEKTAPPSENTKASEDWVPKSIQEAPPANTKGTQVAKRAVEGEVPSTEDLLSGPSPTMPASTETSAPAPAEKRSRRRRAKAAAAEEPAPPPAQAQASAQAPEPPPPPTKLAAAPVSVPPPAEAEARQERGSPEAARQGRSAPSPAAPVPSTEDLLDKSSTNSGPDTSGSDAWVPKAVPKAVVADVPAQEAAKESMKVAMVPRSAPVDNSVDNLLKMANEGKGEMPRESDTWVPKKTATPKPDVDLNKELLRVRAEEKKNAAPKPKVQVRHDINNPEEGVLPVSSFEKFSGPMYGRHREYERRFYPGKKQKSKVPDHDFYVDEVDRKKEIHNVYYYQHQKGKAPRLVAVERHDKVSFMGNYDIEKEDKGKVSSYN